MNAEDITEFENGIAALFNEGKIRAPIHLDGGNERHLVDVFKTIDRKDWVCGTWRMHGKCLLHGVPPDRLRADIIAGKSITLCYPEYKIVSSAIVGGILPIAMGIAWWIKRTGGSERVHCFVGDMASCGGAYHEANTYAHGWDLPVRFIIENNGKSVMTETTEVWGCDPVPYEFCSPEPEADQDYHYYYDPIYPHAGAGKRIQF